MDLTFQVPMQYCSLQHQTFLLSPVTSTTRCCFCFASVSSFFLELFLHLSLVAYWVPTNLGSWSFSALSFCLFILFMGFSRQEYWKWGDGIPVELFQILKDDAVKVLHSICQQMWKTQQWPQDWKRAVFIPIPKKGNPKECLNYRTIALISHASKVMLKILQARLQ